MRQLLLAFLPLLFLPACEKENFNDLSPEQEQVHENGLVMREAPNRIDVCHKGKIKSMNVHAIPDHQAHGDAVDMDGDGFFDIDNPCSETDCDDTSYDPGNFCGCIEGEYEIDFNGPLYVAPPDNGIFTFQQAIDKCNEKDKDGCDWSLPTLEELNAMYLARNDIGGFNQTGTFPNTYYRTSVTLPGGTAWAVNFANGAKQPFGMGTPMKCRCVRR